ncbi:hypothetical protein [Parasphingorhabdus pacifica]
MDANRTDGASDARREEMTEEFRRLLDAAATRAEEYLRGLGESEDEDVTPSCSTACGWCPVCALAAALRGQRTGNTTRMVEQMTAFVRLLRQALAEHAARQASERSGAADPESGEAAARGRAGASDKVQRIDVRRVSGSVVRTPAAGPEDAVPDAASGAAESANDWGRERPC